MRGFLFGLFLGAVLAVGGFHYYGIYEVDLLTRLGAPTKAPGTKAPGTGAQNTGPCSALVDDCLTQLDAVEGLSGSARLNEKWHLVVHDYHSGEADENRLGLITPNAKSKGFEYLALDISQNAWRDNDDKHIASDLESACTLSSRADGDNAAIYEFLVAESGRSDLRAIDNGVETITKQDWQGRVFHIEVKITTDRKGKESYSTRVLATPKLMLPPITPPVFPAPKAGEKFKAQHSIENFEGLACMRTNEGSGDPAKYLVVAGERGGAEMDPKNGQLFWGTYDVAQALAMRNIEWITADDLKDIKAPGKVEGWRDISGLSIDDKGRLFATAGFDSGEDHPPFKGALYQLGVICLADAADQHGRKDVCDYQKGQRPALIGSSGTLYESKYHKFETVAAAGVSAKGGELSIGAEDESHGGVWWPAIANQ